VKRQLVRIRKGRENNFKIDPRLNSLGIMTYDEFGSSGAELLGLFATVLDNFLRTWF
jgi:hypothetical protein